jgi:acetylornithine/succinyldiaminopimelate/putrescine aminotransferase
MDETLDRAENVTYKKVSSAMKPGCDGSTFGGNPMAMAAATVAFRRMQRLNLTANVVARSKQIAAEPATLRAKHAVLGEVRVKGLFVGFDLPSPRQVAFFQEAMKERGVLTSLSTGPTVRLLPPLIISGDEVEFLLRAVDSALSDTAAGETAG